MAEIKYYNSPLSHSFKKIEKSNISMFQILVDLEIEKDSLSVSINNECPDSIDLNYIIKENDLVEIRRIVQGGNDSGTKRTLATVVQIVAVIGATVLSGGGYAYAAAAVAIGGSLVSGALNRRAMEIDAANASALGQDSPEISTATNDYSLASLTNEARALSPVQLLMGDHLMVPDIQANAYLDVFGDSTTKGESEPAIGTFYPGIESSNGPEALNNTWITMPANYIAPSMPPYEIKIAPYHWKHIVGTSGPVSPANTNTILNQIKTAYSNWTGPSHIDFNRILYSANPPPEMVPLVVYHSNASDPYYKKYNIFHFVYRTYQKYTPSGPNEFTYSTISNVYSTPYDSRGEFYFYDDAVASTKLLIKTSSSLNYYYPPNVLSSDNTTYDILMKINSWMLNTLNGGSYSTSKTLSYPIEYAIKQRSITSVINEGIPYSSQIFNFGIGDLEIAERKIASTDVLNNINMCAVSNVEKTAWEIPVLEQIDGYPKNIFFMREIHAHQNKKLINIDSPNTIVGVDNEDQYNWVYYTGGYGEKKCSFSISGRLYGTSQTVGFVSNTCAFEIQCRTDLFPSWKGIINIFDSDNSIGVFSVTNNNTKVVDYPIMFEEAGMSDSDRISVRIRKINLDSSNNNTNKICDLSIVRFRTYNWNFVGEEVTNIEDQIPMNTDGIYLTALVNDTGTTNRYSAKVRAKCWVWDFDLESWSWTYTRNPAWWYLYFAHGGFKNTWTIYNTPSSYPLSPTVGWMNYVDHEENTEIIFGCGLKDEEIDIDKIKSWALFCEENNLFFDSIVKDDNSCQEILERIANVGRGSVTYYNGKLSVVYEDQEQVPTSLFGMGNIKAGSFKVNYLVSDPTAKIICNFIDRENWETNKVEAVVPFSNADNLKIITVNLVGITELQQAQRECNVLAARQFYQRRTYEWGVDIEGLVAKRGDLVYLSHDSTQYGFSGRIKDFSVNNGTVESIKANVFLDSSIEYITIRSPDGILKTYKCSINNDVIIFIDPYLISDCSFYYSGGLLENNLSSWNKSIPEDFVFIAGEKETTGKIVRISSISASDDYNFTITAVDEDPAMWAYEYDTIDPEQGSSFEDSNVVLDVQQVEYKDLGNGLINILWNGSNCDMVQIINKVSNLPIEGNGSYTFTNGSSTVELDPQSHYTLEVKPFAIGTPYKSISKTVEVWTS